MEDCASNLFSYVKKLKWLHNRKRVRVPLGKVEYELIVGLSDGSLSVSHSQLLLMAGVQPFVISPIPPLIQLILYGCGCKHCNEALPVEREPRSFMLADEIMLFYLLVLQSDCTHTKRRTRDAHATSAIKHAFQRINSAQMDFVNYQKESPELDTLWTSIQNEICIKDGDVSQLINMGKEFASISNATYTLELIHRLESIVWTVLCRTAPPEFLPTAIQTDVHLFLTPLNSICLYQTINGAVESMQHSVADQRDTLNRMICKSSDDSSFREFDNMHFPTKLQLQQQQSQDVSQMIPIESGCYVTLAMLYMKLCVKKTQPLIGESTSKNNDTP